MRSSQLMKDSFWRLFRGASVTLAAVAVLFVGSNAVAACGDPSGIKPGIALKMPFLVEPGGGIDQARQGLESGTAVPDSNTSIVGLWYVNYTSGGEPLYESFDQWHGDGTELENPNLAPATGPLCVGVWKQVGTRTFRLHHVGWNFDINGNSLGSFTLDETNIVSRNGLTYKGTFDLKFYDVDGNLVDEVTGTQTAARITVH
jgi:hypothetical protein